MSKGKKDVRLSSPSWPGPAVCGSRNSGVGVIVDALSKAYQARCVLDRVDLTIEPGEFVAIVGRSGCGKSTLLRLLAGLETAEEGRIGFDCPTTVDMRIMFQDSRLLPWKTVVENVVLGMAGSETRARGVLRQVGLDDRADEWPAVLSGGQRQRVALARALVHDPALLLLDEPLGALDALTRIEMQQLIETLWCNRGFTAVLVTHDVQEAIALADRVILIEDGKISLDRKVAIPRPRQRGSTAFSYLENLILARLLRHPDQGNDRPTPQSVFVESSAVAWAI